MEIPAKPPEEFTYQERRADLLSQIEDLGHPKLLNQSEQAERFGVSQTQIHKDLDRIAESSREHVADRDRRALTVESVVNRAVIGLLREEKYRKAARTVMEFDEWCQEFQELEELAARISALEEAQGGGR
ncbi:hypothetical protein [Halobacterium jilantaiense]|uniref:hypothetical protein n=1 Tax=Halobacterium jilantaiense TaxID=355548 RepID=UPI000B7CC57C|nr:hypothetical protein [Halobacterium jilantaiense]